MERRIRLAPSGQEIPCPEGDTVLAALERAGHALPNNCRAGACGECKVRVLEGELNQGMVLDMALSAEERAAGWALTCMAKPLSPVLTIAWGDADARPKLFPPREGLRYVVVDRTMRTPRLVELRLRPLGTPMRYWPGQYVMLGDAGAGAPPRSYSIVNAPQPDGELVLWVTRLEPGLTSRWIHERLMPGDMVSLDGPYGTFVGDPGLAVPILCLAAGSGLAPIRCLTEAAFRRGYREPVTWLVSARMREDVFDLGTTAYWLRKHRRFEVKRTLTREAAEGYLAGRIPALLPGLFPDLSRHGVFVAGGPEFVDACVAAARALGARPELVHAERFTAWAASRTSPGP